MLFVLFIGNSIDPRNVAMMTRWPRPKWGANVTRNVVKIAAYPRVDTISMGIHQTAAAVIELWLSGYPFLPSGHDKSPKPLSVDYGDKQVDHNGDKFRSQLVGALIMSCFFITLDDK